MKSDTELTQEIRDALNTKLARAKRLFDPTAGSCRSFPGCQCADNCQKTTPIADLEKVEATLGYLDHYDRAARQAVDL